MQTIKNIKLYCPDNFFSDMLFQQIKVFFQQKGKTLSDNFPCNEEGFVYVSKKSFLGEIYQDFCNEIFFTEIEQKNMTLIAEEVNLNKNHGVLHIFMLDMLNSQKFVVDFFNNIKNQRAFQGINVFVVPFGKYTTALEIVEVLKKDCFTKFNL
jgi:hypothetical protein